MANLGNTPKENAATHLLLVGNAKVGKSTYIAQAAIDGHKILYIDSDNGIAALNNSVPPGHPGRANVEYVRTTTPLAFVNSMFTQGVFRWNETQDAPYSSAKGKPGDQVLELKPSMFPPRLIVAIDGWTPISLEAMREGAKAEGGTLEAILDGQKQGMYEEAGRALTLLCAIIQHAKFHVIVHAHGTMYERMEKPAGVNNVKQKDMILKETLEIPMSCSRPNGFLMGKYFTDIGWLEINRVGKRVLDFKPRYDRIAGGGNNETGPVEEQSFTNLFSPPDTSIQFDDTWIKHYTHDEFVASRNTGTAQAAAKSTPADGQTLPPKASAFPSFGPKKSG